MTLPETVVSASRIALPAQEIGSAVTVITRDQIERKQVRMAADILREVPGIAVSRNGPVGGFTQVRIRGAESNQTLVLIDGVEVNDPSGASEFDFGSLLATEIERIEVLRGPQSALYGSDAIGGVINITTRSGRGPLVGEASLEGGSFSTAIASARLSGGSKSHRYFLGVTGLRTAGVSSAPASQGNTEKDGHWNQTISAKLGFTPYENIDIDFSGRVVRSNIETDPQPAVAGVIKTVDGNDESDTLQQSGRARVAIALFGGAWTHAVSVGIHKESANSFSNDALSFEADGKRIRYDYQTTLSIDTPDVAHATHALSLLVERKEESQFTSGSPNLEVVNYGYAGEYRLGLWDRLFLSGSVRRDDNEIFKDSTTFRTTGALLIDQTGTRAHGSYGTGVKNPTLFELFGFGPNFVPNPKLQPEKSRGWDLGIEQSLFNDGLVIDLTYFNNRITKLIDGSGNTAVNLSGTSPIQGVELSIRAQLLDTLSLSGQYTYTDGEDANAQQLVRAAKHIANVNLAYGFDNGRGSVDLGVVYNGRQKDFEFSNFFANRRAVTLQDYVLINIAGSYKATETLEVFGRIENLLDTEYEDVLGFATPGLGAFFGVRARGMPF